LKSARRTRRAFSFQKSFVSFVQTGPLLSKEGEERKQSSSERRQEHGTRAQLLPTLRRSGGGHRYPDGNLKRIEAAGLQSGKTG